MTGTETLERRSEQDSKDNGGPNRGFRRSKLPFYIRAKFMFVRVWLLLIVKVAGLKGLYWFGQVFGTCEFWLQGRKRRRLYPRFEELLGERLSNSRKRMIVRRQMCRIRCDKMIYTIMDRIDRKALIDRFEIVGKEYLDRSLARGKGSFFMFSHQGSHHLGGILCILSGYPLIGLRDPNESPLRIYVQEQFEKNFPEFASLQITPSDSFARTFFHAFKNNAIVAAAMDVWRNRGNGRMVKVTVFGQEREFMSGMTHIALRSGATILVGFLLSLPNYHYRLVFHPWLNDPDKDRDTPETVHRVMQDYARLIESHVREYPCHQSKAS